MASHSQLQNYRELVKQADVQTQWCDYGVTPVLHMGVKRGVL